MSAAGEEGVGTMKSGLVRAEAARRAAAAGRVGWEEAEEVGRVGWEEAEGWRLD